MTKPFGLPREVRPYARAIDRKGASAVEVSTPQQRQDVVQVLIRAGFSVVHDDATATTFRKPKKFGGPQVAMALFGFLLFIFPAVIFFIFWLSMPTATTIVPKLSDPRSTGNQ